MRLVMRLLLYLVLLDLLYCCNAYKLLLVFPVPTKSHAILGEGYVKHLAEAGHEITYITSLPMTNPPDGVRQIDVSEFKKYMDFESIFDTRVMINPVMDLRDVSMSCKTFLKFANGTLHINEVQNLLADTREEFDVVIVEWLYTEIFAGLAVVFNCPLIWASSMEPHFMVLSLIDEYLNPAYTFHHTSRQTELNFWHRVHQLWITITTRLFKWKFRTLETSVYVNVYEKFVNKRGRLLPLYEHVRYNGSLMFGNSHVTTGEAITLPQNYKSIGGYHIKRNRERLSKDLQKIMDDAAHGVIYFSIGSMLQSSRIPKQLKSDILKVFGTLNQTVIWKLEEMLSDLPKNVHILPWAPQTSILAHSNCVLFITQGGLLSQIEAVHFGVPMIGVPLFADQFVNINSAQRKGFAKRVDLNHDGAEHLNIAIREVLGNSSYQERIMEYSNIYHHRQVPPEKELVHWVEHVIKTRGAIHLRSPALHVPWYQKYYIDLAAVVLLLTALVIRLCRQGKIIWTSKYCWKKKQL